MRTSLLVRLAFSAVVAFAITPANAKLYHCEDGNGKTILQDIPCPGSLEDAVASYNKGDYARAIYSFRPMAEKGNAQAQSFLGAIYGNGYGIARDYQEAVKWWRLAAAQGDDGAQNFLGLMYANGYGVAQSDQEASKWWQLAAAQGNAQAQENLNALNEKTQAGRDLLAQSAPGLLTDVPPAPPPPSEIVTSQPGLDPFAPPQTASKRGSYLDRAAVGGISGAVLGALAGLFILVRAVVKKFKAPAAAGALAIYRDRPQAIKIGAALLLGCTALLAYFLFFKAHTVDDYLNDYPGRLEKIHECGQVPDVTKDRECMNAYTAQRMFMLR